MDVGIRELKARLSDYLERASRGETIRVTDRGRPKAIIAPIPGSRMAIDLGVKEGWITPGNGEPPAATRRRYRSRLSIEAVLTEDRGT